MIITQDQIKELEVYIDNIDELIKAENVQDLLDEINDVIVDNILENDDEPNEVGIKLQQIYDEIYQQN